MFFTFFWQNFKKENRFKINSYFNFKYSNKTLVFNGFIDFSEIITVIFNYLSTLSMLRFEKYKKNIEIWH